MTMVKMSWRWMIIVPKESIFYAMTEKTRTIFDGIEDDSSFFSSHVKFENPSFKLDEIKRSSILGDGEFGTVRKIRSFINVEELCPFYSLHQDIEFILKITRTMTSLMQNWSMNRLVIRKTRFKAITKRKIMSW